jgi:hypothetical protein
MRKVAVKGFFSKISPMAPLSKSKYFHKVMNDEKGLSN